jgi:hypothetical protein
MQPVGIELGAGPCFGYAPDISQLNQLNRLCCRWNTSPGRTLLTDPAWSLLLGAPHSMLYITATTNC